MSTVDKGSPRNWRKIIFYVLGGILLIAGFGNMYIAYIKDSLYYSIIALVSFGGAAYVLFRIYRYRRAAAKGVEGEK